MSASPSAIIRKDSAAYWDAEGWDPDDRVYVGANIGETSYKEAVHPEGGASSHPQEPPALVPPASDEPVREESRAGITRRNSDDFWNDMQDSSQQKPSAPLLTAEVTAAPHSSAAPAAIPPTPGSVVSSDSFWDQQGMDLPVQARRVKIEQEEEEGEGEGSKRPQQIPRVNSGAYWDAEQWDPDNRIYVGADAGQQNHLIAVDLQAQEKANVIWRVWQGGLASKSLGLGEQPGPPVDVANLAEKPKLDDLYEITETLGVGSFGAVRSAVYKKTGQRCAVKVLGKTLSGERFRKGLVDNRLGELCLQLTASTPHVNVTTYLDLLEGPNHWYSVMEELSGPELMQQLEEQFPVTEAYVQRIMPQVLRPLAHIHGKPVEIVHRDVKLPNYRFRSPEPDAPLVLIDFGFACKASEAWDGVHCGTPMFMAPEVVGSTAKAPHLPAIDLWSAGVILYLFFTGDCPIQEAEVALFGKPESAAQAQEVLSAALEKEELKLVPREAHDLLRKLLVVEPAERITAAQALDHPCWLGMGESPRRLPVSSRTTDKVRLHSSRSSRRLASRRDIELDDVTERMERICSGEADELAP